MNRPQRAGRHTPERMALVLTLLQVLTAGAAYVVNILSARGLGADGRGFLVLVLQLTYFAAVFVVLGIERPFMALVRMPFGASLRSFAAMLTPGVVFASAILVGSGTVALLWSRTIGIAGMIMAVYMLLNGLGKGVRVAAICSGNLLPLVLFTIATQGGLIVVAILLVAFGVSNPLIWFGGYAVTSLTAVVILLASRRTRCDKVSHQKERVQIRKQGLRLIPGSIGNTAMVRSDRIILPVIAGFSSLGIYSAVSTVMEMASWPIQQWVDSSLGRWKRSGVGGDARRIIRISIRAVAGAAFFAALVGLIAYGSILWLLPTEFRQSLSLIVPLGLSSVVYSLSRVQQGVLVILNQGWAVSVIELVGMGGSVLAYFILIPQMGAMGAAVGSVVGYSISALAGGITLHKGLRDQRMLSEGMGD